MLAAQLGVEVIFELAQGRVGPPGDGDGGGLVLGGVRLDVVLERVVVDVIYSSPATVSQRQSATPGASLIFFCLSFFFWVFSPALTGPVLGWTYGGSIAVQTRSRIVRRISWGLNCHDARPRVCCTVTNWPCEVKESAMTTAASGVETGG